MAAPDPYQPADEQETALRDALRDGDQVTYLKLLTRSTLIIPVSPAALTGRSAVVWPTTQRNDQTLLLAYTSVPAMLASTQGAASTYRTVRFAELAATWPNPQWWLAVNPGLPIEGFLPATLIAELAKGNMPLERVGPDPATDARPTIMQQTLPASQLPRYLQHHYGRVGGYVHRVADVIGLTTPQQLVTCLGLTYPRSPFALTDPAILALRWPMVNTSLYRTPYGGPTEAAMRAMPGGWVVEHPPFHGTGFAPGDGPPIPEYKVESIPLPHHAELYRLDSAGTSALIAVFDADLQRWLATNPTGAPDHV